MTKPTSIVSATVGRVVIIVIMMKVKVTLHCMEADDDLLLSRGRSIEYFLVKRRMCNLQRLSLSLSLFPIEAVDVDANWLPWAGFGRQDTLTASFKVVGRVVRPEYQSETPVYARVSRDDGIMATYVDGNVIIRAIFPFRDCFLYFPLIGWLFVSPDLNS